MSSNNKILRVLGETKHFVRVIYVVHYENLNRGNVIFDELEISWGSMPSDTSGMLQALSATDDQPPSYQNVWISTCAINKMKIKR